MARDFNGSNQYATSTLQTGQTDLSVLTIAAWLNMDSVSQYKRWFHMTGSGAAMRDEFDDNATRSWTFCYPWTTTSGGAAKWATNPKPSTSTWLHRCITYDSGSSSNDPIIYIDGVSQTLNEWSSPSGAGAGAAMTTLYIGSESGSGQFYDGRIAEFGIWNRVLTPAEVTGLSKGFAPSIFRNGLVLHLPLIGKASPETEVIKGASAALTNSPVAAVHPRVIYPANYNISPFSASGVITSVKDIIGGFIPFAR